MRILVAGDAYCSADALRPAFASLTGHDIDFIDVRDDATWTPATASETSLREYMGTPGQLLAALDGHEVLVIQGAPVSAEVIAADPALRLICCARGGPVNVDLAAASARGIPVVTTPGKNADAVAELTIALIVMLARRVPEAMRHVDGGGVFGHDNYEGAGWFGHDLAGKTLGLVGVGLVGSRVATRAQAFGMRVVAFDPFVDAERLRTAGIEPVDLAALLARSDVVSLHARLTPDSRGMIGAAEIGAMRPGAWFVNTARHELVDEAALRDGLASGRLGGVALDVATPSPATGRHPLLAYPNVVMLPHVGGATIETLAHGGEMAVAEIERFIEGRPLVNVANRAALAENAVAATSPATGVRA
jgi:D-3-phosphoglycerate dehydrogenase / 2-oxoglutarate reductase